MFRLIDEKRSKTYPEILRVWVLVALYAVAHDQYLVRIEPRHFTEYHAPLWEIENPAILAAIHSFLASFGPGLTLGMACVLVAWKGAYPRLSRRFILTGVLVVILLTEGTALLSWLWVRRHGASFYPDAFFPERSLPLVTTQTIQVTCYLASAMFSFLLLCTMGWVRWRRHRMRAGSTAEN